MCFLFYILEMCIGVLAFKELLLHISMQTPSILFSQDLSFVHVCAIP